MPMWQDHLQLDLQLNCVVTYDKKLGCIHVVINDNLKFYNNK